MTLFDILLITFLFIEIIITHKMHKREKGIDDDLRAELFKAGWIAGFSTARDWRKSTHSHDAQSLLDTDLLEFQFRHKHSIND